MRFRTILADPPWSYNSNVGRDFHHGAKNKYSTLSVDDIAALPVGNIAEVNSVLLLWGTWALLDEAREVMRSWGFTYKTGIPWIKTDDIGRKSGAGIGFHTRSISEYMLIGTRGKGVVPPAEKRIDGVIMCKAGRHSAKPEKQYDFAEAYGGPYLELFARNRRNGWVSVGNELDGLDIRESLEVVRTDGQLPVVAPLQDRLFHGGVIK